MTVTGNTDDDDDGCEDANGDVDNGDGNDEKDGGADTMSACPCDNANVRVVVIIDDDNDDDGADEAVDAHDAVKLSMRSATQRCRCRC
jgi:hypothetical protein